MKRLLALFALLVLVSGLGTANAAIIIIKGKPNPNLEGAGSTSASNRGVSQYGAPAHIDPLPPGPPPANPSAGDGTGPTVGNEQSEADSLSIETKHDSLALDEHEAIEEELGEGGCGGEDPTAAGSLAFVAIVLGVARRRRRRRS